MNKIREFINKNKLVGYGLLAVAAVLVLIIVILLLPSTRTNRYVAKADAYLAEDNSVKAAKYYKKAANITPTCVKAHYGLVISELSFDKEKAVEDFNSAREMFLKYPEKVLLKNQNLLLDAYNLVPDIYDNYEDKINAYSECYELTYHSMELYPALSDAYLEKARAISEDHPVEALEAYETALSFRGTDEEIIMEMTDVVKTVISDYRAFDKYEEAYALLEKYKDAIADSYETILSEVEASEKLYEEKTEVLSVVYSEMNKYFLANKNKYEKVASKEDVLSGMFSSDFTTLLMYDDSVDFLVKTFSDEAYIYTPDGFNREFTGVACGVYTYGDVVTMPDGSDAVSYYFYFGEYVEGKRSGYGYSFLKTGENSYLAYEGNWADDAPNGFGTLYQSQKTAYSSDELFSIRTVGNWVNGYADGVMKNYATATNNAESSFYGEYEATNGTAKEIESVTDNYEIEISEESGRYLISVLASVTDGYDYYFVITAEKNELLGVFGF